MKFSQYKQKLILIFSLFLIFWSGTSFALPNCLTNLNAADCEYSADKTATTYTAWSRYNLTVN